MKRDILGTYSCTFSAVRTSSCNVEGTDKVEHILFKGGDCSPLLYTRIRIVEYAVLTGTCGTYIAAGIAADALGKFISPEFKSFIRSHAFKLVNKLKTLSCRRTMYVQ